MNLDKLLKKIEDEKKAEAATKVIHIDRLNDDFTLKALPISQRRTVFYSLPVKQKTLGDYVTPEMRKAIYNSIEGINELAKQAKDNGLIDSYYDILEVLFKADELSDFALGVLELNNIISSDPVDEVKN